MSEPVFTPPGEGGVLRNPVGGDLVFKVRGEQSDGRLTAVETIIPPGQGPPLHVHPNEDETLYVIEGEVRFRLGDELCGGAAGSFAFVPRGMPHTFQNVGQEPARMIIHFAPGGIERFFEGFAALDLPGPEAFATAAGEAGVEIAGPPLAQSHPG
jgi:quercetin dioxygenase-like cupin family protein